MDHELERGAADHERYRLPKRLRLRTTREFRLCYSRGVRVHGPMLLIVAYANGLPISRLGLSIPGKFGNAPRRNRMKRICREAFRLSVPELPRGLDLVIVGARSKEAPLPGLSQARAELLRLTSQALERLEKGPPRKGRRRR